MATQTSAGSPKPQPELKPGTFANQSDLPRVPLPSLSETAERFLEWCAPLLTDEEFAATKMSVDEFVRPGGPGEALQADLQRYDRKPGVHSWLDDFWPQRYLGRRDPIALNANFFFLFPDTGADQIARATALILGGLDYKLQLDREDLPVANMRGMAMCMEEVKYLFSATRIPAEGRDGVRKPYSDEMPGPSKAKHVLVFHKGHAFSLDVVGPDGQPHTPDEISGALKAIQAASPSHNEAGLSVGHLTTMPRATWAQHRTALLEDSGNAALIDKIEQALFVVPLEDLNPTSDLEACDHLLHGNSANRYFDKAVTLPVFANGRAGINIEHCGLDGTAVLEFVDALHARTAQEHAASAGAVSQGMPEFEELVFDLSHDQQQVIAAAGQAFAELAKNAASMTFQFKDFGTKRIKSFKVSPDAFYQMAMQVAHHRTKGMIGATYESIATRQYNHGRTEAMRVVTPESVAFVEAMHDAGQSTKEKIAAFRDAAKAHIGRAKACQAGAAPEQHLWELLMIHGRRGAELGISADTAGASSIDQPAFALFDSPGWIKMRDDFLSTSSAPSINAVYFGFGSTAPQCIGVGYVLRPDAIHAYLCTPVSQIAQRDAFAKNLSDVLHEMADMLEQDEQSF